jgi:branched-chain amino acid transport system substrate-binding protein
MIGTMKGKGVMVGIVLTFLFLVLPGLASSQEPIKIGYLSTSSGTFAADGEFIRNGFELFLQKVNYKVGGRKIEVLHEDDKMDPRTGLVKAKRLVEENKVHMISGVVPSSIAYAIKDYLVSNKIPFIIANAGADDLTQRDFSPYVFRSSFSNSQHSHVLGDWLYKKGHRRLIMLTSDYSAGYEHIGGVCRVFTNAGGEIVEEIYTPLGTMDFAPYLSRISPDRADGVVCFLGGVDSVNIVKQYAQYGLKGKIPLYSLHMVMEHLQPEMGDAALGMVDCSGYMPSLNLKSKEHLDFVKTYQDKFGKWPNFVSEGGYVAAQIIVKGLELIRGNVEDTDAFIKGMEKAEIVAPRGPLKIDKFHNPIENFYISVLKKTYDLEIAETYPNISQFWKWSPEEFMKMTSYKEMKGKWAKGK